MFPRIIKLKNKGLTTECFPQKFFPTMFFSEGFANNSQVPLNVSNAIFAILSAIPFPLNDWIKKFFINKIMNTYIKMWWGALLG